MASILDATAPLFTVLVAHLLTPDGKLMPLELAGVVVGLAGAVPMTGPDALQGLGVGLTTQIACMAGAMACAFAAILVLVTFLIPVSAILPGWLVLGKTLWSRHLGEALLHESC